MKLPGINVHVVVFTASYLYVNLIHSMAMYVASKCLKMLRILKVASECTKVTLFPLSLSPLSSPYDSYIWHDCSPHVKELP